MSQKYPTPTLRQSLEMLRISLREDGGHWFGMAERRPSILAKRARYEADFLAGFQEGPIGGQLQPVIFYLDELENAVEVARSSGGRSWAELPDLVRDILRDIDRCAAEAQDFMRSEALEADRHFRA